MLKHVYRAITCVLIFVAALLLFGQNIKEKGSDVETIESLADASFPIMYVKEGDYLTNIMHGYTGNIDAKYVRDVMIPVDSEGKTTFCIKENSKNISKALFELSDVQSGDLIEDGMVRKFDEADGVKTFDVVLHSELNVADEYAFKITLVTDEGSKLNYFARVKKTTTGHVDEVIEFARYFHENTFDKSKSKNVVPYIEPNSTMDNKDLAYVNIHSSLDMISFGSLTLKMESEMFTNIREVNEDTAVVELVYYATANTDSGIEKYKICEGYRIKYTSTRMYLLFYDRTMETQFDIDKLSVSANEFKLGITSDNEPNAMANSSMNRMCFVRNGDLWYYNMETNTIVSIFTFKQDDTDYISDIYDAHDIMILNMEDSGNVYFMVYGYMNRGDYEGRTALVLCKYFADQNRVAELANIPIDVPYSILKQQMTDFAYVNESDIFFFSVAGSIYEYNITSGEMNTLASDVSENDMIMSKEGGYIAWQNTSDGSAYTSISIRKFSTLKTTKIEAKKNQGIKILGVIKDNLVYGYSDSDKPCEKLDGTTLVPLKEVIIADIKGEIVKNYKPTDCYVTEAVVDDNKITLMRVKKDSSGKYADTNTDCIFGNKISNADNFKVTNRVTDKTKIEWYLALPEKILLAKDSHKIQSEHTLIKEDTTVRVFDDITKKKYYYVYSYHGLDSAYKTSAKAIVRADERMGVVFDNSSYKVWERGMAEPLHTIEDIEKIDSSRADSVAACITMLAKKSGNDVSIDTIKKAKGSIMDVIGKHVKGSAVDLTGTPIKELEYSISRERPVLAMMAGDKAVLIIGYNSAKITYIDPTESSKGTLKIEKAEEVFGEVGNVYISYLND